jgi:hypothetical protein
LLNDKLLIIGLMRSRFASWVGRAIQIDVGGGFSPVRRFLAVPDSCGDCVLEIFVGRRTQNLNFAGRLSSVIFNNQPDRRSANKTGRGSSYSLNRRPVIQIRVVKTRVSDTKMILE